MSELDAVPGMISHKLNEEFSSMNTCQNMEDNKEEQVIFATDFEKEFYNSIIQSKFESRLAQIEKVFC